jgi:hypothetical protein
MTTTTKVTRSITAAKEEKKRIAKENAPSPRTKKYLRVQELATQKQAFEELLALRVENKGAKYGDIQEIVDRFQSRGFNVTRNHLEYRQKLHLQGKLMVYEHGPTPMRQIFVDGQTSVSPITNNINPDSVIDESNLIPDLVVDKTEIEGNNTGIEENTSNKSGDEEYESTEKTNEQSSKKGGRKKGSTKKAKVEHFQNVKAATTKAAKLISVIKSVASKNKKRCRRGKQQKILNKVEKEFGLPLGTINLDTVRSRVKSGNLDGFHPEQQSPLQDVEPLIVEWVCRMSRMGEAFSKDEIMQLADELICDKNRWNFQRKR